MPLSAYALLTLAELKSYRNITTTISDANLTLAINAATDLIESKLGGRQVISRGAFTEYFDPPAWRTSDLYVGDFPIISVSAVYESVASPRVYDATTLLVEGTHFEVVKETGILRRISYSVPTDWPCGHRVVKATLTAGYADETAVPADLKQCAYYVATAMFMELERGSWGISSKSDGTGNVTRFMGYIPPSIEAILGKYRRHEFDRMRERA